MENDQDFVIKDGVLNGYIGPSGGVTIPEGVTEIRENTFSDCTGLTSVAIPAGVTKIGDGAFWGCSGLGSVTLLEGVNGNRRLGFPGLHGPDQYRHSPECLKDRQDGI